MASLLLVSALLALPTGGPASPAPAVAARPVPAPLAATDNEGIMRGLRRVALGAAFIAGGLLSFFASSSVLVIGAIFLLALYYAVPPAVAGLVFQPTVLAVLFTSTALGVVGVGLVTIGVFWAGAHAILVLIRLDPDYKPSPGTEFLER